MSRPAHVHREKIADARNTFGDVIARARYRDEPTILLNRGKEAAVVVSADFYWRALEALAKLEAMDRAANPPGSQPAAD